MPIPNASRVRIHYNAYFEMNDEPFDSTYLRNKSFEFKLGANEVVLGLDVAGENSNLMSIHFRLHQLF